MPPGRAEQRPRWPYTSVSQSPGADWAAQLDTPRQEPAAETGVNAPAWIGLGRIEDRAGDELAMRHPARVIKDIDAEILGVSSRSDPRDDELLLTPKDLVR